jgi:hypothetical protein
MPKMATSVAGFMAQAFMDEQECTEERRRDAAERQVAVGWSGVMLIIVRSLLAPPALAVHGDVL